MLKRLRILLVVACLCMAACACSVRKPDVVTYKGERAYGALLVESSMRDYCSRFGISLEMLREDPEAYDQIKKDFAREFAISALIDEKAEGLGIALTEDELLECQTQTDELVKSIREDEEARIREKTSNVGAEQLQKSLDERVTEFFATRGTTREQYEQELARGALAAKVKASLTDAQASEEELLQYYQMSAKTQRNMDAAFVSAQPVQIYYPQGYAYVKNILISFDPNSTLTGIRLYQDNNERELNALIDAQAALKKDIIDEVRAALDSGMPFDEAVEKYNEDSGMNYEPQKSRGYFYSPAAEMPASFREAIAGLKAPGDRAECATYRGYYFLEAHLVTAQGDIPFEDVRASIQKVVIDNKTALAWQEITQKWIEDAEAAGDLKIDTSVLK